MFKNKLCLTYLQKISTFTGTSNVHVNVYVWLIYSSFLPLMGGEMAVEGGEEKGRPQFSVVGSAIRCWPLEHLRLPPGWSSQGSSIW